MEMELENNKYDVSPRLALYAPLPKNHKEFAPENYQRMKLLGSLLRTLLRVTSSKTVGTSILRNTAALPRDISTDYMINIGKLSQPNSQETHMKLPNMSLTDLLT